MTGAALAVVIVGSALGCRFLLRRRGAPHAGRTAVLLAILLSILYLVGSKMDWVEDDFAAGFTFENPNAKGACGCGESFTV